MSEMINNREYRQKVLKELIKELHEGKRGGGKSKVRHPNRRSLSHRNFPNGAGFDPGRNARGRSAAPLRCSRGCFQRFY